MTRRRSPLFTAKLNILVARRQLFYPPRIVGGVGREERNRVFVFTDAFLPPGQPENSPLNTYNRIPHTCAHELGHALGLSTRNKNLTTTVRAHDTGSFPGFWRPSFELPAEGLMKQSPVNEQMWMRHEDWVKANLTALKFIQ